MIYCTPIDGHEYEIAHHFDLIVSTRPRPQSRPRVYKTAVVSSTKHSRAFKADIVAACKASRMPPAPPRDVPLLLEIAFIMPVKAKKLHGKLHTGRPDLDNMVKAVKDAIVDAGMVEDDSQIVATDASKTYGPHPGMLKLRISRLL